MHLHCWNRWANGLCCSVGVDESDGLVGVGGWGFGRNCSAGVKAGLIGRCCSGSMSLVSC
jgi:hypothetical protein